MGSGTKRADACSSGAICTHTQQEVLLPKDSAPDLPKAQIQRSFKALVDTLRDSAGSRVGGKQLKGRKSRGGLRLEARERKSADECSRSASPPLRHVRTWFVSY